jgi:hypothetical protein
VRRIFVSCLVLCICIFLEKKFSIYTMSDFFRLKFISAFVFFFLLIFFCLWGMNKKMCAASLPHNHILLSKQGVGWLFGTTVLELR